MNDQKRLTITPELMERYLKRYKFRTADIEHHWEQLKVEGGHELFFQTFSPRDSICHVILLHGYLDHAGTLAPFINFLCEQGCSVYTCDWPGHGLSSGERYRVNTFEVYMEALCQLLTEVKKHMKGSYHIIGHSTGGGIAAQYVLKHNDPLLKQLLLVAPLARSNHWHASKVMHKLFSPLLSSIPRRYRENSSNERFLERVKNDPLQAEKLPLDWVKAMMDWEKNLHSLEKNTNVPVTVFQGTDDQTVNWKHNLHFYQSLFLYYDAFLIDEAGHHLLNERQSVKESVYKMILDTLKEK